MSNYLALQVEKISPSVEEGLALLKLTRVLRPELGEGSVRIAVHAAAANYFDLLMLIGKYQSKPPLPFSPGSEASGVVIEVGTGVKNFRVGDEVVASMAVGCMAEEMVVPEFAVFRKPSSLSHVEAASVSVGFFTAYHGLVHRGGLQKGEWLLVTGASGGMGAAAIQLGKVLGARVIAAVSTEAKATAAKELGADAAFVYDEKNLNKFKESVEEITNYEMVDVVYEIVGGRTFDECVRCMAPNGRLLVIGFAGGTIPSIKANLPLIKGFSVVGVRSGAEMARNPALTREMVDRLDAWCAQGLIKPSVTVFSPSRAAEGYAVLNKREAVGKVAVSWRPHSKI